MSDEIYLRNLHLNTIIGPDRWHRPGKAQPMILSLRLKYNIKNAAAKDDVSQTLNYGTLCNKIMDVSKDNSGRWALREFAIQLCRSIQLWVKNVDPGREQDRVVSVEILLPKGALRVEGGLGIELSMCGPTETETEFFIVKGLRVPCIIGVHPHEKVEKQTVAIDLKLSGLRDEDFELNGQPIVRAVTAHVEGSAYETLEALATSIARVICMDFKVRQVTVSVEKPSALPMVDGAGVEIKRDREFFEEKDFWQVQP